MTNFTYLFFTICVCILCMGCEYAAPKGTLVNNIHDNGMKYTLRLNDEISKGNVSIICYNTNNHEKIKSLFLNNTDLTNAIIEAQIKKNGLLLKIISNNVICETLIVIDNFDYDCFPKIIKNQFIVLADEQDLFYLFSLEYSIENKVHELQFYAAYQNNE